MSSKRKTRGDDSTKPARKAPKTDKVSDFGAALTSLVAAPVKIADIMSDDDHNENTPKKKRYSRDALKRDEASLSEASRKLTAAKEKMREKRRGNRTLSQIELEDRAERKALKQKKLAKKLDKLVMDKDFQPAQHTDLEKKLIRIATKGVVTLFNAVNTQQKKLEQIEHSIAARSEDNEKPAEKDSEKGFLELLRESTNKTTTVDSDSSSSDDEEKPATKSWNVFDDNFMVGKESMKNWDQSSDSDSDSD